MKKINSVTGQGMRQGSVYTLWFWNTTKAVRPVKVIWIPFQRPTVTEIGLDGSENFTSHLRYMWSGGSLYPF